MMELIRGRELAQKIYDQITEHPETHDQWIWQGIGDCGTTYCIAGWAVALQDSRRADLEEGVGAHPLRSEIRDELGLEHLLWEDLGRELLGLSERQSTELFFSKTEDAPRILAEIFELDQKGNKA